MPLRLAAYARGPWEDWVLAPEGGRKAGLSAFVKLSSLGRCLCVPWQTCSPASMGVNVCTLPSATVDVSMPLDRAASWVSLGNLGGGGKPSARPGTSSPKLAVTAASRGSSLSFSPITVYNAGPERDSICRTWGQHHVETFDGLYFYLSGKGSYMLVGRHEPEGQSFSIQVRRCQALGAGALFIMAGKAGAFSVPCHP